MSSESRIYITRPSPVPVDSARSLTSAEDLVTVSRHLFESYARFYFMYHRNVSSASVSTECFDLKSNVQIFCSEYRYFCFE